MKHITIFIIIIFFTINSFAQIDFYEHPDTTTNYDNYNIYRPIYGGDFTLQVGTFTNIALSPKIGLPIGEKAVFGVGADFLYQSLYKQRFMAYGGNVFAQLFPLKFLIIHTEAQMLNIPDYSLINPIRRWDLGLYAGGGLKINTGTKSYMAYMLLWNFNYTYLSPYSNPTMRISFYF